MSANLSQRIRLARRNMGLNQAEFGAKLGVNQATVSRWESGTTPDFTSLGRIAKLTNIDMKSLVNADIVSVNSGPSLFIKGEVAAGVWKEAFEWDQGDWMPYHGGSHVNFPDEARFGLIVSGESMNEVYPPGTVLDCVSCIHGGIEKVNSGQRVIVVRRKVGGEVEATVKEYLETEDGIWLVPKSRNPAFHQAIPLDSADPDIEETVIVAVVKGSYRPE